MFPLSSSSIPSSALALDTLLPHFPHHPIKQRAQNQRIRHSLGANIHRKPLFESMESHVRTREVVTCNFLPPNPLVPMPFSDRHASLAANQNRSKINFRFAVELLHRLLQEPFKRSLPDGSRQVLRVPDTLSCEIFCPCVLTSFNR